MLFAIARPNAPPVPHDTLETLQGYFEDSRVVIGEDITQEFHVVDSSGADWTEAEHAIRPNIVKLYEGRKYYFDEFLEPGHFYWVILVVVKGETSPQWIVIETDSQDHEKTRLIAEQE